MKKIDIPNGISVLFMGPSFEKGPLPAIFYFALSAEDTLQRDPFNQPVQFIDKNACRIFSITLPGHENNLPPENALNVWAERMSQGEALIPNFIQKVKQAVDYLTPQFKNGTLTVMGLSRGAFIACHLAAICPQITHILGYAPLTKLSYLREFKSLKNLNLDLEHIISEICNRTIRFYSGNCDVRVGVEYIFSFIHKLSQAALEKKIKSPPIELIIGPSIGYKGHGTSPEVFKNGVNFLKKQVLI